MQKGTTEMSSGGQKMVERSYGVAGSGKKITNFLVVHDGRRRRFASPILARPTAVCREIPPAGLSGCGSPSRPARVIGGRPLVPRLVQSLTARK